MTKSFPKIISDTKSQIQKAQITPSSNKYQKTYTWVQHIQASENQRLKQFEKSQGEKNMHRGVKTRTTSDFSETTQATNI